MQSETSQRTVQDQVRDASKPIADAANRLVEEGNARRVVVERDGHVLVTLPLTIAIVGAVLAPWLAALGLIVALVFECRVRVETVPASDRGGDHRASDIGPFEGRSSE